MKVFLLFIFCLSLFASSKYPKIKRGSFLLSEHPQEIAQYLLNFSPSADTFFINIAKLRDRCHLLTDIDITHHKGLLLPKKKKAFKRRIKQICEKLENVYFDNEPASLVQLELFYELETYALSFLNRAEDSRVTIIDKIKFFISSSINWFSVKKGTQTYQTNEAKNLHLPKGTTIEDFSVDELSRINPLESPYWRSPPAGMPLSKRFKHLQKLKKISPTYPLYVLFDSPSLDGSAPKVKSMDLDLDNEWSIKWGDEVHTDVVGSRIFAALGFDVDHPYYYGKGQLRLILPPGQAVLTGNELVSKMLSLYNVDISPFIYKTGTINQADLKKDPRLSDYLGYTYISFVKALVEARPDRVKRLGSIIPKALGQSERRELRGSLLAHLWIDNWDTKEQNTLMTTVHMGERKYRASGVFSDLGTSFGVKLNYLPADFRVGLVNHYPWSILKSFPPSICARDLFRGKMNAKHPFFKKATYSDLKWMANQIANITQQDLHKIINKANWPTAISTLYFHKLAHRREQILSVFDIQNNWSFRSNPRINIAPYVKNGLLIKDIKSADHPIGFMGTSGRFRNYGARL